MKKTKEGGISGEAEIREEGMFTENQEGTGYRTQTFSSQGFRESQGN